MKPNTDPPGTPFSFDGVATWLCPSLWDETKKVPFRGALFILSYSVSTIFFFSLVIDPVGLIVSIPLAMIFATALLSGAGFRALMGLLSWWQFKRKLSNSR
ncbi:hypothetical protein VLK31_09045 [Variovorax sp. H27-G14]|uniref:hypothetical protein n=1 Tax=Variovorax sp. H27-G14 TaxID=3111914 RepID=UPI0038FC44B3